METGTLSLWQGEVLYAQKIWDVVPGTIMHYVAGDAVRILQLPCSLYSEDPAFSLAPGLLANATTSSLFSARSKQRSKFFQ